MSSPVISSTNPHGVRVQPLDFDAPGAPTIKTYHGISIMVGGQIVGRIQSWNPSMYARNGKWVYELNHLTFGRPVDYVPSINTGYSVSAKHTEVWDQEIERALGYPVVWADLMDQTKPFTAHEHLWRGNAIYRIWTYAGCWIKDRNEESYSSEGTAQIIANCNIDFVSRTKTH